VEVVERHGWARYGFVPRLAVDMRTSGAAAPSTVVVNSSSFKDGQSASCGDPMIPHIVTAAS
jgi:hypothetical protein